ncbi:hypothetical protein RDV64_04390 [Acuticoccus sp. MNP-M23]|uniref:hypothetical protein n=1 Tax=Acuticoccus sp. MNP-M23 TaxID=3072793 RepID=UPI0028167DAA|nr:hypothetical protein [Acuticoccus sp. MNP-M23]WMS43645.1 hypothetical protein RDV64_04390 [Acuticoccus sp. MNP-M23]
MARGLALFAIGLIFGGGIGFLVAAGNGITLDGHDHGDLSHHGAAAGGGGHDHGLLNRPAGNAPAVTMTVTPDTVSGYNIALQTTGFRFAPENAGKPDKPGEGHAHLYVNGAKVARLYGPWVHVPALPEGRVHLEVTLNANDHRTLAVDGLPIHATRILHAD